MGGAPERGDFAYQPALDGVRAVAVVLVLLFHQGFSWMTGGYVGVSVFFTLSGYLITSLLLLEHDRTGRVSFRAFYQRRLKRLMPASLLCLSVVAVLGAAHRFPRATSLRADVVSAALQFANWHELTRGGSYAQLIHGAASPVDHFWSLSVEEQFYWIWPVLFAGIALVARTRRRRAVAIVTLAVAAVAAAPLIAAQWGPSVAYWATPARLGEILVGAGLAVALDLWASRPVWLRLLAWPALASIVWAGVALPSDHGLAYRGWLGVGALVSAALIAAVQVPGSLRSLLSLRPLVGLGRISYGVYLFHWPVYLLLDATKVGVRGWSLFAVRSAVTLGVSVLSYRIVERPVRSSRVRMAWVATGAAIATSATVALSTVVVPVQDLRFGADPGQAASVGIAPVTAPLGALQDVSSVVARPSPTTGAAPGHRAASPSAASPVPNRPVRILVIGDSTAEGLSAGLVSWAADHPDLAQVDVLARPGCGFVRLGRMAEDKGSAFQTPCDDALDRLLPAALRDRTPDVVVALVTLPDAVARVWPGSHGPVPSTDPRYVARLHADYDALATRLLAVQSLRIAWLTAAPPAPWFIGNLGQTFRPEEWAAQTQEIDELASANPRRIEAVDFGAWMAADEARGVTSWRPDGLHLGADGARRLVDERLGRLLLQLAIGA